MEDDDADTLETVRTSVEKFISQGAYSTGKILTTPSGYSIKNMNVENSHLMTQILSSFSDLQISRIFQVPIEVVGRADGKTESTGQGLKPIIMNVAFHFWKRLFKRCFHSSGVFSNGRNRVFN